ncbi:hypothetical protein Zmor_008363 [Zophobas morio]|uniref:Fibrinogen C-terminal domain-containing protein n=1 Tax=Zophobas morio TaxID=2755281 RepID=A0AA38IYM5_9CUCU|nr:hypothetical protein Zmor_008363 [Zophobas morio]
MDLNPLLLVCLLVTTSTSKSAWETQVEEKLHHYETQLSEIKKLLQSDKNDPQSQNYQDYKILLPQDCQEVLRREYKGSGLYRIKPVYSPEPFWVWCDLTTRGGGWTYVLNRFDGSENFYRNWTDYKEGFGDLSGEFWLGLDHLHQLTNSKSSELLFELVDWDIKKAYQHYNHFVIGNETEGYAVKGLGESYGDAGDSFSGHVNMKFTTADKDQDTRVEYNCAAYNKGAWWYSNCYFSHLTGVYVHEGLLSEDNHNIQWNTFHGYFYSLKQVRMMVRPRE